MEQLQKIIKKCILIACGPTLYGIYGDHYEMNILESIGTRGCNLMYILYRTGLTFLPITVFLFRNNALTYIECFLIIYGFSFITRFVGRFFSSGYTKMINSLQTHNDNPKNRSHLINLFSTYNISLSKVHGYELDYPKQTPYIDEYRITNEDPITIGLGTLAIYSFGRRLVFPGSVSLLKSLMRPQVNEERCNIIMKIGGKRIPIQTRKGNVLDVLFVDRRHQDPLGKYLVIISDGNAGYCERGLSQPWIDAGYSTLAYNAPGIGESSGTPFYDQICDGAEAVMTLAGDLGFDPEIICLYGWSIGGFASAWLAANYPVRGVVLDATFDNLMPLTENVVGTFAPNIVRFAVCNYFNMNLSKLITRYNGPITFIRRRYDEVIITDRSVNSYKSNRINTLFKDFLASRYHFLFWTTLDDIIVDEWLDADDEKRREWFNEDGIDGELHEYIPRDVQTAMEMDTVTRTALIRRICLWHFIDLETSHNTVVPSIRCILPDALFPPGVVLPPISPIE